MYKLTTVMAMMVSRKLSVFTPRLTNAGLLGIFHGRMDVGHVRTPSSPGHSPSVTHTWSQQGAMFKAGLLMPTSSSCPPRHRCCLLPSLDLVSTLSSLRKAYHLRGEQVDDPHLCTIWVKLVLQFFETRSTPGRCGGATLPSIVPLIHKGSCLIPTASAAWRAGG